MEIIELFFISLGLAMDAFAVAVCKGLSIGTVNYKNALIIGGFFGLFQAIMPLLGYILGNTFQAFVISIDHWVVFILLLFIGLNMIRESFNKENNTMLDTLNLSELLVLSIATSIDAFAVGITFAFFNINLLFAIAMIGTIAFILSFLGVIIGNNFGNKNKILAEAIGGAILISMGLKILLEHLHFI